MLNKTVVILSLVVISLLSPFAVCTNSSNRNVRSLDSEVDYNDELGKFYYPITLIKLPEDQGQTLTPSNTRPGETYFAYLLLLYRYTLESSKTLTSEELSIDETTGVVSIKHVKTSKKGEVTVTVKCSNTYSFTIVIDFLESKYMIGAKLRYSTPYNIYVEECRIPFKDEGNYYDGPTITTSINMFKMDQTMEELNKIIGESQDQTYIYFNITGYIYFNFIF